MPFTLPDPLPNDTLLRQIGAVADRLGLEGYLVGGAVRDALLGRPTTDLDFVAVGPGSGIRWAKAVAEELDAGMVHVYENFGTAGVRVPRGGGKAIELEFVGARKESYRRGSRKPIVEEGSLQDDQARRDFTVNALAITLNGVDFGVLVDPFGGVQHLEEGVLKTPLDPRATFSDDPLRMIRAARFAAQLDFRVDPVVFEAMTAQASRIEIVSQERITEELRKIVASRRPSIGFKILYSTGLLQHILPELADLAGVDTVAGYQHKDNFYHTLQVVDNVVWALGDTAGTRPWLRWAALLHDIGKARTKRLDAEKGWTFHGHEDVGARMVPKLFRKLRLPNDERQDYVQQLVRLHHRPVALVDAEVTDAAVRRLLFDAGDALEDLMLLVRADITSKNPKRVRRYLRHFDLVEQKFAEVEERDRLRNFQPPLDGYEIMQALGEGEGVAIGIVKERLREAILEGEIPNEYEAARAMMDAITPDALRRARLFREIQRSLSGHEKRAMGAIKEAVFWSPLPLDHDAALEALHRVKTEALGGETAP